MSLLSLNTELNDFGVVDTMMFGSLPSGLTMSIPNKDDRFAKRTAKTSLQRQVLLPKKASGIMGTIVAHIF